MVQSGKLSHMFAKLDYLQEKYSAEGKVSVVYVKIDDPKNLELVLDELKNEAGRLQGLLDG